MRVYCKCLNIELEIDSVETKPRTFTDLAKDNEEFPSKTDHEFFNCHLHSVSVKSHKDLIVAQDDIVKRRKRSELPENPDAFGIYAYLPKLVLTHQSATWMIRECFLCHTPIMAFFPQGKTILCPDILLGMSSDDGLQNAQTSTSARFWMLSRSALAKDDKISDDIRFSSQVKKQLESMSAVWHIAQLKAKDDMHRRLEELRRQEEAAFEELLRTSAELQRQVTNSYLSLLTLKHSNPSAYVVEEKQKDERGTDDLLEKLTEQMRLETSQPAGDIPDPRELTQYQQYPKPSHGEVEMATDALDFSEADVFDDYRASSPLPHDQEETAVGRTMPIDDDESADETEDNTEFLSTSAISSSMKAGRGMRAASRHVDDRLPDTDAFNAMTDAERAYAIERASYQRQDHRLHEIYGDMEPPHLRDLRRQAERARLGQPTDDLYESPEGSGDKS